MVKIWTIRREVTLFLNWLLRIRQIRDLQNVLIAENRAKALNETWKTNQIFLIRCNHPHSDPLGTCPHYAGGINKPTIAGHFGFVFEEISGREITWLSWRHRVSKSFAFKIFTVNNAKPAFLNSFSRRVSVNDRPNRRNRPPFTGSVEGALIR